MDCRATRMRIQDFLERALPRPEEAAVAAHLRGCARCAGRRRELERIAAEIAALPDLFPSAGFGGRVLAALGAPPTADTMPWWAPWAAGALASSVACSAAGVAWVASSRLGVRTAVGVVELAANPARTLAPLALPLARAVWSLGDVLAAGRCGWRADAAGPLRLAAAALVAASVLAAVSRRASPAVR